MKTRFSHPQVPRPAGGAIDRRRFLQAAGGASAGLAAFGFPAIVRSQSPNSKLNLAIIGSGGRGGKNLAELTVQGDNVVALCDVNANNLESAYQKHPGARRYSDFRKLYDEAKDIDAFVVSVPEHVHAFATLPALKMKKPVYCEKPLTRDVHEARIITKAAAEAGVPTQMGTQMHASDNFRRVVELVDAGVIGDISKVDVWVSRAWGWQSPEDAKANEDIVSTQERPTEEMTPPDILDWDLWVGPAPYRPFHEVYFPGPKWYRWWDFGNGTMSDLGSHWNDLPWWALKLDAPLTIEAGGPPPHPEIAPASMWARYEYGKRGNLSPVTLTWHQGTEKPEIWTNGGIPQWGNGMLFTGSKGMILSDYRKHVLLPEEDFKDFQPPAQSIPASPGHHVEWLEACKNGTPTGSPFSYAGPLTEANHLGNVAYRAGAKLEWDAANMKFPNHPEAEKYLGREYREGWSLT